MAAIWEFDGLLNKTVRDAIMAIFNFPIHHHDHAGRAVLAAREIQRRWHTRRELLVTDGAGLDGNDLGIVSVSTPVKPASESSADHRDLTVIGTVVNTAARAQSVANAGRILVTKAVCDRAPHQTAEGECWEYHLKGFEKPIELYTI